jgi:hypothetical protein
LALPVLALAQEKPADNMQIVREKIRADKKLFIAQNMQLTESEAKAFWPVYDTYQNDLAKLNDRTIKLIQDYAKNYKTMTDETAQKLLDEYMAIEGDRLKLRESYRPQFMKVLPAKRVARFYQLENKIHAVVSYDLARQIPLIK